MRAVAALACLAFAAAAAAEPPPPGGEWAFAPKDARPHPSTRYGLPFDPVFPRYLTYTDTHTGRNRHALDFVLPTGTPVWAAREGVVARVVDGFTEGGLDPALMNSANLVAVLHADGTFALYVHLSPGIPVKEGERVARGQVIGASGHTGFSSGPHLHFVVCRNGVDGVTSIPFRFGAPGTAGFLPKIGSYVGFPPRPTIELAFYDASGKPIRPGVALPVRAGEEARIRVEARRDGGSVRLSVQDRGIGVAKAEHKKIFEKFYRAEDSLVHETKGSGLGLSLVKHIIDAHGGRVEVDSAPGRGSVFTLVLPGRPAE